MRGRADHRQQEGDRLAETCGGHAGGPTCDLPAPSIPGPLVLTGNLATPQPVAVGSRTGDYQMANSNIKIGPQFFRKEFNDYANKYWAFVREALQNCFDAPGSKVVNVAIATVDGRTVVTFDNDGEPMTRELMENKLLALGESGKDFNGSAGGFGKAKVVLYFAHPAYSIRTGRYRLDGCGGSYDLVETDEYHDGTSSTVTWDHDCSETIARQVRNFAMMAQWSGTLRLTVDGKTETLETNHRKGSPRRELDWCKIYTNRQFEGILIVRIGGQPMFTRSIRYKGCVLVELTGSSGDRLVASRDRLQWTYQNQLDEFVTSLTVDTKSALREQIAEYKRYEGEKLRAEKAKPKAHEGLNVAAFIKSVTQPAPQTLHGQEQTSYGSIHSVAKSRTSTRTISIGPEFIIKNTTGMNTPEYYLPGDKFSRYSMGLVKAWGATLKRLYEIHGLEGEFSIGFVLDEESMAEAETSPEYGLVYYLSPAEIAKNEKFNSRSFRARYSSAWTSRHAIMAIAAHEFVHGAYGLSAHDESYASKLTEVMGVMMAHANDFAKYYR